MLSEYDVGRTQDLMKSLTMTLWNVAAGRTAARRLSEATFNERSSTAVDRRSVFDWAADLLEPPATVAKLLGCFSDIASP